MPPAPPAFLQYLRTQTLPSDAFATAGCRNTHSMCATAFVRAPCVYLHPPQRTANLVDTCSCRLPSRKCCSCHRTVCLGPSSNRQPTVCLTCQLLCPSPNLRIPPCSHPTTSTTLSSIYRTLAEGPLSCFCVCRGVVAVT